MITSKLRIPLLCLIILALAAQVIYAQSVQFRVTATENQSLYTGPGYNYAARAGAFAGNTFGVVSTGNGGQWYKLDNGYWMDARKARRSGSQQSTTASSGASTSSTVASDTTAYTNTGVNIRGGPSTSYAVVGGARSGTYVTIYSQSGQWYQVYANGVNGWIFGPLLTFSGQSAAPRYVAPAPRYVAPTPVPYTPPVQQYRQPNYSQSCSCNYNSYNCRNFSTQRSAQACYQSCLAVVGYDIHWLDDDNDGIACEWNP